MLKPSQLYLLDSSPFVRTFPTRAAARVAWMLVLFVRVREQDTWEPIDRKALSRFYSELGVLSDPIFGSNEEISKEIEIGFRELQESQHITSDDAEHKICLLDKFLAAVNAIIPGKTLQ